MARQAVGPSGCHTTASTLVCSQPRGCKEPLGSHAAAVVPHRASKRGIWSLGLWSLIKDPERLNFVKY